MVKNLEVLQNKHDIRMDISSCCIFIHDDAPGHKQASARMN